MNVNNLLSLNDKLQEQIGKKCWKKLHLNFYELSPRMREEIKKHLINNYNTKKDNNEWDLTKIINWDDIFDTNNAGIDIDAPAYLIN